MSLENRTQRVERNEFAKRFFENSTLGVLRVLVEPGYVLRAVLSAPKKARGWKVTGAAMVVEVCKLAMYGLLYKMAKDLYSTPAIQINLHQKAKIAQEVSENLLSYLS